MEKSKKQSLGSEEFECFPKDRDWANVRTKDSEIEQLRSRTHTSLGLVPRPQTQLGLDRTNKYCHVEDKETFLRNLIKKIVDEALDAAVTSFTMHTASREYYVKIMGETIAKESLIQVMQYLNSAGDTAEGDNETRELALKLLLEALQKAMEYNNSCDYSKLKHRLEMNLDRKLNRVTVPVHEFYELSRLATASLPSLCEGTIGHTESPAVSAVTKDTVVDNLAADAESEILQTNHTSLNTEVMNYDVIAEALVADAVNSALEDGYFSEEDQDTNQDVCIEKAEDLIEDICPEKYEVIEDLRSETGEDLNTDICNEEETEDIYADDVVGMAVYMLHCY